MKRSWKLGLLTLLPAPALAASFETPNLTLTLTGLLCLTIFIISYGLVMAEEHLKMRKSKPVLLAAGLIWILVGWKFSQLGMSEQASIAIEHNLLEYTELLLFLLVAMTYINALEERRLFDVLRTWMINKGFSFYQLFWLTGWLAFFISPIADNLTTALLMCTVVLKVGGSNTRFINMACVNIVVAANAGGAFSPFGDITTLMVWQAGIVEFNQFLTLFIPSIINFIIPAFIMSFFVEKSQPEAVNESIELKRGAKRMVCFFLLTILTAVLFHSLLGFPPVIGMMMGFAYLQFFGYFLRKTLPSSIAKNGLFMN